jgi:hypothetical protein
MFMNNILIIAEIRMNLTNSRMEIYPLKGLMLKAPVAPFPLIVSCSKSRTIVDAGRCTQCRPSNVHREVDKADPRKKKHRQGDEDVPRKKRMASSREDTPQKTDRPHTPEQVSQCKHWFRRPALPKTPCTQRIGRGVLGCNSTRGHFWREKDVRDGNVGEIRKTNQLK